MPKIARSVLRVQDANLVNLRRGIADLTVTMDSHAICVKIGKHVALVCRKYSVPVVRLNEQRSVKIARIYLQSVLPIVSIYSLP